MVAIIKEVSVRDLYKEDISKEIPVKDLYKEAISKEGPVKGLYFYCTAYLGHLNGGPCEGPL